MSPGENRSPGGHLGETVPLVVVSEGPVARLGRTPGAVRRQEVELLLSCQVQGKSAPWLLSSSSAAPVTGHLKLILFAGEGVSEVGSRFRRVSYHADRMTES